MAAGLVVVDERKLRFEIEADALRARSAMAGCHSGEEAILTVNIFGP